MLGQKLVKFCHCIFWKIKGTAIFFQSFLTFRNWPHVSIMGCFYEFLCHFKLCLYLQGVSLILPLLFKAIWKGDTILMGHPVHGTHLLNTDIPCEAVICIIEVSTLWMQKFCFLDRFINVAFSKNNLVGAILNKPFFKKDITAKEPKLSLIFTSGPPNPFQ